MSHPSKRIIRIRLHSTTYGVIGKLPRSYNGKNEHTIHKVHLGAVSIADTLQLVDIVCLFVCLGFNGTFSTNRLYRAITVG